MTATSDVPETAEAAVEERWQQLEARLERAGEHARTEIGAAIASLDACLDSLRILRHHLTGADRPRP